MLQRARRALNAENGRLALGIVEELDERFPKGLLVEERSATRILSLCMLERAAEAGGLPAISSSVILAPCTPRGFDNRALLTQPE